MIDRPRPGRYEQDTFETGIPWRWWDLLIFAVFVVVIILI